MYIAQKQPPEVFHKKKFPKKTPVLESFLNKVAGLRPAALLKKDSKKEKSPVNIAKFVRTPILKKSANGYF